MPSPTSDPLQSLRLPLERQRGMLFFQAPVPSHTQTRPQSSHGIAVAPPCWAGPPTGRQKCFRNSLAQASTASLDQTRPLASSKP
jgi:hypothetical protein